MRPKHDHSNDCDYTNEGGECTCGLFAEHPMLTRIDIEGFIDQRDLPFIVEETPAPARILIHKGSYIPEFIPVRVTLIASEGEEIPQGDPDPIQQLRDAHAILDAAGIPNEDGRETSMLLAERLRYLLDLHGRRK